MTDWLGRWTYCEDCVYQEDNHSKCEGRVGCYCGYSEYNEEEEVKMPRCRKCVNEMQCSKNKDSEHKCPDYKRDAPDGGTY